MPILPWWVLARASDRHSRIPTWVLLLGVAVRKMEGQIDITSIGSGNLITVIYQGTLHFTIYSEEDNDVPSEKLEKSFPPKFLGDNPGSNEKIFLKNGPYGYYVQLGEDREGYMLKRASFAAGGSKGVVTEQILSSMVEKGKCADFVLCIGDDRSDEDMFEVIASIKMRELVAANTSVFTCTTGQKPSKARYYLDGTNEVINMLGALTDVADPSSPTPEPSSPTSKVEAEVSMAVSFALPSQ